MKVTVPKLVLIVFALLSPVVFAQGFKVIMEVLTGYEEVPVVSTAGNAQFRARISNDETSIQLEMKYADLEGSIQQSHIHIGQKGVNGGISVFLCTILGNGPTGIQSCPASPATIS